MIASDGLKFQFATDGEGNYGYLGADGSLIPFSGTKVYYLGTGKSYNIKTLFPNDYSKLTVDNFLVVTTGKTTANYKPNGGDSVSNWGYANTSHANPKVTYTASTGALSITTSTTSKAVVSGIGEYADTITVATNIKVYLVLGDIELV